MAYPILSKELVIGSTVYSCTFLKEIYWYGSFQVMMYSYGSHHMAKQKQDNQLEPTYSSSVRI